MRSGLALAFAAIVLAGCLAPPKLTPIGPPAPGVAQRSVGEHPEASVTRVLLLRHTDYDAKIYSTAGGDPAINGLYTYLALYVGPAEGWRVFQLGDFNQWELAADDGRSVSIDVSRSFVDPAGDIQTARERLSFEIPPLTAETLALSVAPLGRR